MPKRRKTRSLKSIKIVFLKKNYFFNSLKIIFVTFAGLKNNAHLNTFCSCLISIHSLLTKHNVVCWWRHTYSWRHAFWVFLPASDICHIKFVFRLFDFNHFWWKMLLNKEVKSEGILWFNSCFISSFLHVQCNVHIPEKQRQFTFFLVSRM